MITTIQLNENIKNQLERLKDSKNQTYEEVISNLMKLAEDNKRKQKELLIEGYKETAEESLRICKEWEAVDSELDVEW
jgi:uncharacterized protein YigA (DUF484 family)